MGRSKFKGPFFDKQVMSKISAVNSSINNVAGSVKTLQINTSSRASAISPEFVGSIVFVHNGMRFVPKRIISEMIGYKFGELVMTRRPRSLSRKRLKNKKSSQKRR